jgi:bacillithiol system protein YtxJ
MNWIELSSMNQLDSIITESFTTPQLLFKHSTRCSISRMALSKTERNYNFSSQQLAPYYLDLLQHRDISAQIALAFNIEHQSPQMLLIKDGKCIFSSTHNEINPADLQPYLA